MKKDEREKLAREQELADMRTVLGTTCGKRVVLRLLEHCRIYDTPWEASAKVHYNCGRQDVGRFIIGEIMEADPHLYPKLLSQNIKLKVKESINDRREVEQRTRTLDRDRPQGRYYSGQSDD